MTRQSESVPVFRHTGVALVRAAVATAADAPSWWPDPADAGECRAWLQEVWAHPVFSQAIAEASPILAQRVEAMINNEVAGTKPLRRAVIAVSRYVLRAIGRPTPFGLFAGVASVTVGSRSRALWGNQHVPTARVDTAWLADVIVQLEAIPELLDQLRVVFTDLAVRRGTRLECPRGPDRVTMSWTRALRAVAEETRCPVRFDTLISILGTTFANAKTTAVRAMLTELVQHGVLITELRAPHTTTDPLTHILAVLEDKDTKAIPATAQFIAALSSIRTAVRQHNQQSVDRSRPTRASIGEQMRVVSPAGRGALALDLHLDCDIQIPATVIRDAERAASALLRLTRHPAGQPVWREYHAAFCDRYGIGTLVPVREVVDPDAGLGFPADYPGTVHPTPPNTASDRDRRLLAVAWQAVVSGDEVGLTDDTIEAIAGTDLPRGAAGPSHVEVAVRIHADTTDALDAGDYTLVVAPARAGGTLTSRFTATMTGSGLEEVYRGLPTSTATALPVQLSFGPAYPHAENTCRVPAYLPHVVSLGEHRDAGDTAQLIPISDLAVTATAQRLYLVSMSRGRIVEPQVFHALALDKQPPPLARFLAHLHRGFLASWTAFDWGPAAEDLPYLPRVRYGRAVLSPARWRLAAHDLPDTAGSAWENSLKAWQVRWRCPDVVELRDADRALPLTLSIPAHIEILRAHLRQHGHALLTETGGSTGWCADHAHEIALPLVATTSPTAPPHLAAAPILDTREHGQLPGARDAHWVYAKIYTHPERCDDLIADQVPTLAETLGDGTQWWYVATATPTTVIICG